MITLATIPAERVFPPAIMNSVYYDKELIAKSFLSEYYCNNIDVFPRSICIGDTMRINDDLSFSESSNPYVYYILNFDCVFQGKINNALSRFSKYYKNEKFELSKIASFISEFKTQKILPLFSLFPNGAKARFTYNNREYAAEINIGEPDFMLVSTFIGDNLKIKDGNVSKLKLILESFDGMLS
jgi:hypothetical protein